MSEAAFRSHHRQAPQIFRRSYGLSDAPSKWVDSNPWPERCDVEIPSADVQPPNEAFSTRTLLRNCAAPPHITVGGEASHVLELDRTHSDGYERLKSLAGYLTPQPEPIITTIRHFLRWPRRALSWARPPRRSLLVSTAAELLALAPNKPRPTWPG